MSEKPNALGPWPHRFAVLLACATFPLLWVGGLVTTTKAGMAVPDWPSTYGYNLFLYPISTWLAGPWDFFIEHGHRLFAAAVGLISIVLCVAVWRQQAASWVRWLALGAVALVIAQGVLGGMRVLMNERLLAMLHGCIGPLFFLVAMGLVSVTSDSWEEEELEKSESASKLRRTALLTAGICYLQLVFGALLRHMPVDWTPGAFQAAVWAHLLTAGAVVVHVILVSIEVFRFHRHRSVLVWPVCWLMGLTLCQLALGVATWVVKYSWPQIAVLADWDPGFVVEAGSMFQTHVITAHVAVGAMIVAQAARLAWWSWRCVEPMPIAAREANPSSADAPSLQREATLAGGAA